jgi:hypothetical protein
MHLRETLMHLNIEILFRCLALPIFYMIWFYKYSIKILTNDPETKINVSSLFFINSIRNIDVIKFLKAYALRNENRNIEIGIRIYHISLFIVFALSVLIVARASISPPQL